MPGLLLAGVCTLAILIAGSWLREAVKSMLIAASLPITAAWGCMAGRMGLFVSPTPLFQATGPESLRLDRALPLLSPTISFRATRGTVLLIWHLLHIELTWDGSGTHSRVSDHLCFLAKCFLTKPSTCQNTKAP